MQVESGSCALESERSHSGSVRSVYSREHQTSADTLRQIAELLARAFFTDPFYVHIMPDPRLRTAHLPWWMAVLARYTLRTGRLHTLGEPVQAAALWLGPDAPLIDNVAIAVAGLAQAPFRLGLRGFARMMKVSGEWERLHKQQPTRHWYLLAVGVEPAWQGKGLGARLLEPVLADADDAGLTCYLETVTEKNVVFYTHRGFDVLVEGRMGPDGPYWAMRRSPRATSPR